MPSACSCSLDRCALRLSWPLFALPLQASLVHIAPELANDVVVDVLAARRTRVVLLTSRHIAYLLAKHHQHHAGVGQVC